MQKKKFFRQAVPTGRQGVLSQRKKGITLPEIMASLLIISFIGAAGAKNALKYLTDARISATMKEMQAMRDALVEYQSDHPGETVSTVSTLVTYDYLMKGFTDAPDSDLETDYKEDGWNEDYVFVWPTTDDRGYIASAGPDGILDEDHGGDADAESKDDIVIALEKIVE